MKQAKSSGRHSRGKARRTLTRSIATTKNGSEKEPVAAFTATEMRALVAVHLDAARDGYVPDRRDLPIITACYFPGLGALIRRLWLIGADEHAEVLAAVDKALPRRSVRVRRINKLSVYTVGKPGH